MDDKQIRFLASVKMIFLTFFVIGLENYLASRQIFILPWGFFSLTGIAFFFTFWEYLFILPFVEKNFFLVSLTFFMGVGFFWEYKSIFCFLVCFFLFLITHRVFKKSFQIFLIINLLLGSFYFPLFLVTFVIILIFSLFHSKINIFFKSL